MEIFNSVANYIASWIAVLTSHIMVATANNEIATGLVVTAILGALVYSLRQTPYLIYKAILNKLCFTYVIKHSCPIGTKNSTESQTLADKLLEYSHDNNVVANRSGKLEVSRWKLTTTGNSGSRIFKTPGGMLRLRRSEKETSNSSGYGSSTASLVDVTTELTCLRFQKDAVYKWMSTLVTGQFERAVYIPSDMPGGKRLHKIRTLHIPSFYGFDDEIKSEIDKCIDKFLSNRQWYIDNDVPYRLSFMLHGIPGTGKTTISEYIAMRFNTSILYNRGGVMGIGSAIVELRKHIPDDALPFVLFDDVDASFSNINRKDPNSSDRAWYNGNDEKTLAALLSILDSTISPDNCVIAMTTNHIEALDEALLRPGRFTMNISVGYMKDATIRRIFEKSYGTPMKCDHVFTHVRACEVGDAYKQNLDDPNRFIELITAADIANKQKESTNVQ